MSSYRQISIMEYLNSPRADQMLHALEKQIEQFTSRNPDIEDFLKHQAIESARFKRTVTYLIFNQDKQLKAYYTIALKPFVFYRSKLSGLNRTQEKKFFRTVSTVTLGDDENEKEEAISVYLIAQLGKNFSYPDSQIDGKTILDFALETLREMQLLAGGNVILVDVEDSRRLLNFYKENQFIKVYEYYSIKLDKQLLQLVRFF